MASNGEAAASTSTEVLSAFRRCDALKEGVIDSDRFVKLLQNLAPDLSEDAIQKAVEASRCSEQRPKSSDGKASTAAISYQEFLGWVFRPGTPSKISKTALAISSSICDHQSQKPEVLCLFVGAVGVGESMTTVCLEGRETVGALRQRISKDIGVAVDELHLLQFATATFNAHAASDLKLVSDDSLEVDTEDLPANRLLLRCCIGAAGVLGAVSKGLQASHTTLTGAARGDAICVDWASEKLYYAHTNNMQVGCVDMKAPKPRVLAKLSQPVQNIALAGARLIVTTTGTASGCHQDAQLVAIEIESGSVEVLAEKLCSPRALLVMSSGRITYIEDAGGLSKLCKLEDGISTTLQSLPFTVSGGIVALDADGTSFAVGSSSAAGEVYVVPADGEPWLSITGIAPNEALSLDAGGCLFCGGSSPAGERPGLEAFPGFVLAAQRRLPAAIRFPIDEPVANRRQKGNKVNWQAVKSVAVSAGGDTIYYSTVKDALRIGRVAVGSS